MKTNGQTNVTAWKSLQMNEVIKMSEIKLRLAKEINIWNHFSPMVTNKLKQNTYKLKQGSNYLQDSNHLEHSTRVEWSRMVLWTKQRSTKIKMAIFNKGPASSKPFVSNKQTTKSQN